MSFLRYIYLTKADATRYGFTHEGSLYGLPAYLKNDETSSPDDPYLIACPKVPALQLVAVTLDALFEVFAQFLPEGHEVETPHHFGALLVPPPTTPESKS